MSLSRSLTREDSNTLAWALRAQQHVPWQISVARVRHIHGADGGCLVPTGFKFQAETNCSVTYWCRDECSPAFPICAWVIQVLKERAHIAERFKVSKEQACPVCRRSLPHSKQRSNTWLCNFDQGCRIPQPCTADLGLDRRNFQLTSQYNVTGSHAPRYWRSRFSGKSAEASHLESFQPLSLRQGRLWPSFTTIQEDRQYQRGEELCFRFAIKVLGTREFLGERLVDSICSSNARL